MHCPKCDIDISDSYQPDEPDVGIYAGWYCDACDLAVGDSYEPMDDDIPMMSAKEFRGDKPIGIPLSELSSQPGDPNNPDDPRHAGYAEFCRIASTYGYD